MSCRCFPSLPLPLPPCCVHRLFSSFSTPKGERVLPFQGRESYPFRGESHSPLEVLKAPLRQIAVEGRWGAPCGDERVISL